MNFDEVFVIFILASFSLNLVLQTGIGIKEVFDNLTTSENDKPLHGFGHWFIMFVVVFLLWLLWTFVFTPLSLGFFGKVFIFPLCALSLYFIDERILSKLNYKSIFPSIVPLCTVSLFFTITFAWTTQSAALLALSFTIGCCLSSVILYAISLDTRASFVSKNWRGIPLAYISAGLLALVFSVISAVLLEM